MFAEFEPAKPGAEHDHVELFVVRHGHNVTEGPEKSMERITRKDGAKRVMMSRRRLSQEEGSSVARTAPVLCRESDAGH
jgi:hypothetical protein